MDIGINTLAVCEQFQEAIEYPVFFCNIEPRGKHTTVALLIPQTDAEFELTISPNKTVAIVRVVENEASRTLLAWAIKYFDERGFSLVREA